MKFSRVIVNIMIILLLFFANVHTFAAVIRVPAEHPTIQAGINASINGDTVLVADGVYKGIGNVNIDFKGKQITLKSQNGPVVTIIDCKRKEKNKRIHIPQQRNQQLGIRWIHYNKWIASKWGWYIL